MLLTWFFYTWYAKLLLNDTVCVTCIHSQSYTTSQRLCHASRYFCILMYLLPGSHPASCRHCRWKEGLEMRLCSTCSYTPHPFINTNRKITQLQTRSWAVQSISPSTVAANIYLSYGLPLLTDIMLTSSLLLWYAALYCLNSYWYRISAKLRKRVKI